MANSETGDWVEPSGGGLKVYRMVEEAEKGVQRGILSSRLGNCARCEMRAEVSCNTTDKEATRKEGKMSIEQDSGGNLRKAVG